MDQTASQQLPYPEINDPADEALQLQVLAEAIDAKLVAQFAAQRRVANPPCAIVNLSANQTGVVAGTATQIFFDQILYQQGAWLLAPTSLFFPETGYYRCGAYMLSGPSGAATLGSSLVLTMRYPYVQALPFSSYTVEEFEEQNFQSGTTGNEHQLAEGLVRVDVVNTAPGNFSPIDYSGIAAYILHSNAASAVTVVAGSKMWAYKVGELED